MRVEEHRAIPTHAYIFYIQEPKWIIYFSLTNDDYGLGLALLGLE